MFSYYLSGLFLFMSLITIYKNQSPTSDKFERHINHILNRIKTGSSKELVYEIRATGNAELKKQLPSILFSGHFSYRNAKSLIKHSGFICLDFDKFPDSETLLAWKDTLEGDMYTYCVFLSPSGLGLKCLVKIPPIKENHRGYFEALKEYYNNPYFDTHVSDVCRLCYESYDPYLTINHNSSTWDTVKKYEPVKYNFEGQPADEQKTVNILLRWWIRKFGLYSGERNSNVYKLCAAFNDYGINKDYAENIVCTFQQEGFSQQEIITILKSAYQKTEKHGTLKFTDGKEK